MAFTKLKEIFNRKASNASFQDAEHVEPYCADEGLVVDGHLEEVAFIDDEESSEPLQPVFPTSVCFTKRAWTELLSEVLKEVSTETGGILLGYRNGSEWVVVESIDPGPDSIFQVAYFEYDQRYVTHLVNRVRHYYERPLELLGLWHRHPGSFDQFSGVDDGTNLSFAQLHPAGAISGLVNVDPAVRFTLSHVRPDPFGYARIPFDVLDDTESESVASLRNTADLMQAIASGRTSGAFANGRSTGITAIPAINPIDAINRIKSAIDLLGNSPSAKELSSADLVAWSDDSLEAVLDLLQGDLKAFEAHGVASGVKLVNEFVLQIVLESDREEKCACEFVLASAAIDSAPCACVMVSRAPIVVHPYAPGLVAQCLRRS